MHFFLVKKPVILVQIKNVLVTESLDIFADICDLLEVLILTIIKDRIVDDNTINAIIMIRGQYMTFQVFAVDLSQLEFYATGLASEKSKTIHSRNGSCGIVTLSLFSTCLGRPIGVHSRARISVGKEAYE